MVSRPEGKSVVSSICIYKNKCTKQVLWFVSEILDYDKAYSIDQTHFFSRSIYQAKNHLYRICFVRAQKAPIEKHIQELERSPRVMNILTFATRLKMETYRRQQTHRWVQEELFNKVQDKGILVSSNLRWIHSSRGCYLSLQYIMFQYIEYKMKRHNDAPIQGE